MIFKDCVITDFKEVGRNDTDNDLRSQVPDKKALLASQSKVCICRGILRVYMIAYSDKFSLISARS